MTYLLLVDFQCIGGSFMTILCGVPPEDKTLCPELITRGRIISFAFCRVYWLLHLPHLIRLWFFSLFRLKRKNNLNTSYNIFGECILFTGIGISGGFEVLYFLFYFLIFFPCCFVSFIQFGFIQLVPWLYSQRTILATDRALSLQNIFAVRCSFGANG